MSWAACLTRTWAGRDVLSPQRRLECARVQRGPRLKHQTRRDRNQAPVSLQGLNPVNLLSINSVPGTGPYFSLPSPHIYLFELLDLGLIKHGGIGEGRLKADQRHPLLSLPSPCGCTWTNTVPPLWNSQSRVCMCWGSDILPQRAIWGS